MEATSKTPAGGRGLRDYAKNTGLSAQLYGTRDAERTFRGGYRGATPPAMLRTSRDPFVIASELAAAADTLGELAERLTGGWDTSALSAADSLIVGCGRLVCELRQRGEARP